MSIITYPLLKSPAAFLPVKKKFVEANATLTDDGRFVIAFDFMESSPLAGDSLVFSSPEQVAEFGMFLAKMAEDLKRRTEALGEIGRTPAYFLQQQFIPEQPDYDPAAAGEESKALQNNLNL